MEQVTLDYARDHLDDLFARAQRGEAVEITDARLGTVRLQAVSVAPAASPKRTPGRWKGRLNVDDQELLAELPDSELAAWAGDE